MATRKNIVQAPPLMTSVVDKNGKMNRDWSIFFRDLYARTSYKGGNSIDDNADLLDGTIDTLDEAIEQIFINIDDIANNESDIAENVEDIAINADDIQTNVDDILNLEKRSFGETRPAPYEEIGVAYAVNDLVIYPADDPQLYYFAIEAIADPAGVFDPSKWEEKNIVSNLSISTFLDVAPIKACHFAFEGRATDGAATIPYSFNITSVTRNGIGVYDCVISQQTFYGFNVLDKANPLLSYNIAVNLNTEAFHVEYVKTGATTFTINVFEWIQGIGNKIDLAPYDPDAVNDLIFVTILTDLNSGTLPPP